MLLDLGIVLLFVVSIWCGYRSGVSVRLVKVASLLLALYAALHVPTLLGWLPDSWVDSEFKVFDYEFEPGKIPYWLFAALVFVAVWMVGRLVAKLFEAARPKGTAAGLDNLLGGLYGALRGLLIALLVVGLARLSPTIVEHEAWKQSEFVPRLEILVDKVLMETPQWFTELFEPVQRRVGEEDTIEDLYEDNGL